MKMEQIECSETSEYKIQTPGITQKKTCNIENTAKVWNQEFFDINDMCISYIFFLIFLDESLLNFSSICTARVGRDSSVGVATSYGLDVPGIESRWEGGAQFPAQALEHTQLPIQRVQGRSRV
jgi:hypothetical protein